MSQFFKRFLASEGSAGRTFALGAFGKHPGWDDHIEDLGLETESLVLAKRILYIQGVGGQIDTGAWEKLDAAQRIEEFSHIFLWQRAGEYLIGRMWSSSDGKGRTRYPMVICAHCTGVALTWGLEKVLPRLSEVEQACKSASTAQEVRSILDRARTELRAAIPQADEHTDFSSLSPQTFAQFVSAPALGPDYQGWFRILYQIQSQMASYLEGNFNGRGDLSRLRPQQIRVPVVASTPDQGLLLWRRFFSARIDRQVPTFFSLSPGNPWIDAIIGEPSTQEFFCLRASPSALPLATEVPYQLDEKFKAQARQLVADFQSGKPLSASSLGVSDNAPSAPSGGWASLTQRFFKGRNRLWLALVGVGLIAAAATGWLLKLPAQSGRNVASSSNPTDEARPTVAETTPAANTETATQPARTTEPVRSAPTSPPAEGRVQAAIQTPAAPIQSPAKVEAAPPAQPDKPSEQQGTARPEAAASTLAEPGLKAPTEQPPPVAVAATTSGSAAAIPPAQTATPPDEPAAVLAATGQASGLRKVLTNGIGMVLLWIAALPGTVDGGWVGQFEVTQQQFEQIMGSNPSQSKNPQHPVDSVSWNEAVEFCRKLTSSEHSAGRLAEPMSYALPTQLQWEFFLGDAKFDEAITSRTTRRESVALVGTSPANRYGLFDVLGNVWEFCSDPGAERILKGGAFNSRKVLDWKPLEPTTPRRLASDGRAMDAGFRCILSAAP